MLVCIFSEVFRAESQQFGVVREGENNVLHGLERVTDSTGSRFFLGLGFELRKGRIPSIVT